MIFEWDDEKEKINIAKHGIDFATAAKKITILEAYRRHEFDEEWAYRLAELYDKAGNTQKCVALCDEIILWFGIGTYVDKAMALKEKYQPLTEAQVKMLEAMEARPAVPDDDCPEYTEAELLHMMKLAADRRASRQKQTVTLRLSPAALRKARSLGKGYTSVLSRVLESALNNPEVIQRYL